MRVSKKARLVLVLTLFSQIWAIHGLELVRNAGPRVRRQAADTTTTDTTTSTDTTSTTDSTTTTDTTTPTTSTTAGSSSDSSTASTDATTTTTETTTETTTDTSTTGTDSPSSASSTATTAFVTNTKTTTKATQNKVQCSKLSFKNLEGCCDNPKFDFFVQSQKLACNERHHDSALFSNTLIYKLHKFQNSKTNLIDYAVRALSYPACFTECLFKNINAFPNKALDNVTLVAYFANKLNSKNNTAWVDAYANAIGACVSMFKGLPRKKTVRVNLRGRVAGECELEPFFVMQCVLKTVSEDCDASTATANATCKATREKFSLCNPDGSAKRKYIKYFKIVYERNRPVVIPFFGKRAG
ncbi:serine-rich adhesin for platelets-like [Cloeon dipterum]|uniref:serine-rich adhesin for platelets-like n=1 Tax=Cloeon dipterum TaxID=197152 RepID=UPI0032206974